MCVCGMFKRTHQEINCYEVVNPFDHYYSPAHGFDKELVMDETKTLGENDQKQAGVQYCEM